MKTFDSPKHKISMNIRFFTQSVAIVLIALLTTSFARGQGIGVITPNPIDGTVSNSVTFNLSGFGTNIPIIAGVIVGSTYTSFPIASASSTAVTINIGANALSNGAYDVFAFSFGTGMVQTSGTPFSVGPPPVFNPTFSNITLFGPNLSNAVTLSTTNQVIDGGVQVIMVRNPGALSPSFNAAQSAPFAATITPSAFTSTSVIFSMPPDLRHVGTNAGTTATYDIYLQKGSQIALVATQSITHSANANPTITSFTPTTAPQGGTVTIAGTYLSRGAAPPPPTVEFLDLSGNPLSPAVTTPAFVTRANGTQATFTIPNTLAPGFYKLRYAYQNSGTYTSSASSGILAVTAALPACAAPTLSFTPPPAIYLGTVISGTATNATNVTANIGGQSLSNTGTATNFSFTVTNQTYTTAALSVTAINDEPGVCLPSFSSTTGTSVLPSTFVGLPTPVTLPVGAGGAVSVSGNGLVGNFRLIPSTVANPSVDVSQDIPITATALGGTAPAVLNIPSTVPAGSYRVRLINSTTPATGGIFTPTAFITIGSVPPVITSVSPSLITSTTGNLTITGNNFSAATAVAFGISSNPSSFVNATSFTVVNNTTITVPFSAIPSFNGARNVRVTTPSGSTISTVTVSRPNMTLTSFSPSFASRNTSPTVNNGTIITINGSNLQGLNTNYVVEFQTSTLGVWTQGVPGVLSGGVPNPSLSVNAAGTIVYVRAPHNAVTGKIRLRSLIGGATVTSTNNINLIGTTFAGWSVEESNNNGGETDNVQTIGGATSSVTLFPNPTTDAVSVTTEGFTGQVTVALMDMNGASLETKSVASGTDAQFNLANRQRGVYVVRLTDETGHTELRRLVKE